MSVFVAHLRAEQRMYWRGLSNVFYTFIFPLMLLVFFASFADPDVLVPGIAGLVIVATCFQSLAISFSFHREQGVLKRIAASPASLGTVLAAKVASISAIACCEIVLVALAGRFVWGVPLPQAWGVVLVLLALSMVCFSVLGLALTVVVRSAESAPAVANLVYLPMMFVSGVFYEVDRMPQGAQWVGWAFPLAHLAEPLRGAWHGNAGPWWVHAAVLVGWTCVGAAVSWRWLQWQPVPERGRRST